MSNSKDDMHAEVSTMPSIIEDMYAGRRCKEASTASVSAWKQCWERGCLNKSVGEKVKLYSRLRDLPNSKVWQNLASKDSVPKDQEDGAKVPAPGKGQGPGADLDLPKSPVIIEDFSQPPGGPSEVEPLYFTPEEFFEFLVSDRWEGPKSLRVLGGELLTLLTRSLDKLERSNLLTSHILHGNLINRRPIPDSVNAIIESSDSKEVETKNVEAGVTKQEVNKGKPGLQGKTEQREKKASLLHQKKKKDDIDNNIQGAAMGTDEIMKNVEDNESSVDKDGAKESTIPKLPPKQWNYETIRSNLFMYEKTNKSSTILYDQEDSRKSIGSKPKAHRQQLNRSPLSHRQYDMNRLNLPPLQEFTTKDRIAQLERELEDMRSKKGNDNAAKKEKGDKKDEPKEPKETKDKEKNAKNKTINEADVEWIGEDPFLVLEGGKKPTEVEDIKTPLTHTPSVEERDEIEEIGTPLTQDTEMTQNEQEYGKGNAPRKISIRRKRSSFRRKGSKYNTRKKSRAGSYVSNADKGISEEQTEKPAGVDEVNIHKDLSTTFEEGEEKIEYIPNFKTLQLSHEELYVSGLYRPADKNKENYQNRLLKKNQIRQKELAKKVSIDFQAFCERKSFDIHERFKSLSIAREKKRIKDTALKLKHGSDKKEDNYPIEKDLVPNTKSGPDKKHVADTREQNDVLDLSSELKDGSGKNDINDTRGKEITKDFAPNPKHGSDKKHVGLIREQHGIKGLASELKNGSGKNDINDTIEKKSTKDFAPKLKNSSDKNDGNATNAWTGRKDLVSEVKNASDKTDVNVTRDKKSIKDFSSTFKNGSDKTDGNVTNKQKGIKDMASRAKHVSDKHDVNVTKEKKNIKDIAPDRTKGSKTRKGNVTNVESEDPWTVWLQEENKCQMGNDTNNDLERKVLQSLIDLQQRKPNAEFPSAEKKTSKNLKIKPFKRKPENENSSYNENVLYCDDLQNVSGVLNKNASHLFQQCEHDHGVPNGNMKSNKNNNISCFRENQMTIKSSSSAKSQMQQLRCGDKNMSEYKYNAENEKDNHGIKRQSGPLNKCSTQELDWHFDLGSDEETMIERNIEYSNGTIMKSGKTFKESTERIRTMLPRECTGKNMLPEAPRHINYIIKNRDNLMTPWLQKKTVKGLTDETKNQNNVTSNFPFSNRNWSASGSANPSINTERNDHGGENEEKDIQAEFPENYFFNLSTDLKRQKTECECCECETDAHSLKPYLPGIKASEFTLPVKLGRLRRDYHFMKTMGPIVKANLENVVGSQFKNLDTMGTCEKLLEIFDEFIIRKEILTSNLGHASVTVTFTRPDVFDSIMRPRNKVSKG